MQNVQYTGEMAKNIFDKNPKFLEMVQSVIYDHDMDYVEDEYLSKIDGVRWNNINSCYNPWYTIYGDIGDIAKQIIEEDWYIEDIYDGEECIECEAYIQKMEKLWNRMSFKVDYYSKAYDLLESKLGGMVEHFLDTIENIIDGIVNSAYNDEDYVLDQFTEYSECFNLDNYYLNEDTFDVYKIEHA